MEKTLNRTNRDSKDILARLLAAENIDVEHQPVPTAYFDTVSRRLVLPLWENMSNDLYDMLVGHEVGHALFTPTGNDKTKAAIKHIDADAPEGRIMNYLNVAEDVRIEKAIKDKFPGLRRNFTKAYKDLAERDFFGIAGKDHNDMSFIDRVNIYFKIGMHVDVTFSPEEQVIVDMVDAAYDWDSMVEAAKAMYGLAKEQKKQEQETKMAMPDGDGEFQAPADGEGDAEGQSMGMGSDDDNQDEGEQEGASMGGDDEQGDDSADSTSGGGEDSGESMEDDTDDGESADSQSSTNADSAQSGGTQHADQMIDESELPDDCETQKSMNQQLQDNCTNADQYDQKRRSYVTMPKSNTDKVIVPVTQVMDDFRQYIVTCNREDTKNGAYGVFTNFQKEMSKTVNKMAQQFEMKKSADQYKRRSISDSGIIDTIKMINYRWSDDIFLKNTTIPGAKSHGLVMFIDWSGSMADRMADTMKQLMTLVLFCKKVNIPYDVYAFTGSYKEDEVDAGKNYKVGDAQLGQFRLLNLVSSSMKNRDWTEMMTYVTMLANSFVHTYYSTSSGRSESRDTILDPQYGVRPRGYSLGMTPLDDCIVAASEIVKTFKQNHKLQIVNAVFMTDGHTSMSPLGDGWRGSIVWTGDKFEQERDVKTVLKGRNGKIYNDHKSTTDNLLEWFTDKTGIPAIGIFLCDARDLYYSNFDDKQMEEFKTKKCLEVGKHGGYSNYYVIDTKTKKFKGVDDLNDNASAIAVRNAFVRESKIRKTQQQIMNKFVDKISMETV
tara:strand:- start:8039 stop:10360 length:2322 start_codon:yes stop_codon:yes gene_type:complete